MCPCLFADRQRALVEPLRLAVLALLLEHVGQVIEGLGHIGVVGADGLFADRQRALEKPLRLGVLALLVIHNGQIVEGLAVLGVVDPKACLHLPLKVLRSGEIIHLRRGRAGDRTCWSLLRLSDGRDSRPYYSGDRSGD
jgi:hypothetical protein